MPAYDCMLKNTVRKARNRDTAARSRERKNQYVRELEQRVAAAQERIRQLEHELYAERLLPSPFFNSRAQSLLIGADARY